MGWGRGRGGGGGGLGLLNSQCLGWGKIWTFSENPVLVKIKCRPQNCALDMEGNAGKKVTTKE